MTLVSPVYADVFADMGKIVKVYNLLDDTGPTVETAITETVEQMDRNYQNIQILSAGISNMTTARGSMSSGATNLTSFMNAYLLGPLKADMSSVATTTAGVLADLITQMGVDAETVLTGGVFYTFFFDVYGVTLPVATPTPTIADALAT